MKNKIKYYFYRILANFAFGKTKDKLIHKKNKYKNIINNTQKVSYINCIGENNIFNEEIINKYKIHLLIEGNNNIVEIDNSRFINDNLTIEIYGNNNKVYIGENFKISKGVFINIGCPNLNYTDNTIVSIGNDCHFVETYMMLLESGSKLNIDNNCMFSEQIHIRLSDTHSILDMDNNLLNYGGNVIIGKGVWIGREVRILKNVSIGNNSIVGCSSIVTKHFDESNVIIAGNPAKIVKRNINWSGLSPQKYKEQTRESNIYE